MGRPREFEREEVLDAALELFWANGFAGTSLSDLEHHLGLGRQSLYNAFGDKRSLFLQALDRYGAQASDFLAETLLQPAGGLDAIRRYFRGLLDNLCRTDGPRSCLLINTLLETGEEDADLTQTFESSQKRLMGALEFALTEAIRKGELSSSVDVGARARVLLAQVYGLSVLSRGGMPKRELQQVIEDAVAQV